MWDMLSPETIKALDDALSAVVQEAGDDPQYADLTHALTSAKDALGKLDGADSEGPADGQDSEPRDGPNDPHSFDAAQKRMTEMRKARGGAPA